MSRACVLVADDSVTIQKVFELAFEGEDIDIMVAGDGKSALSMALNEKPDMIIADVNMPEMDGFELCQAIKKNPETNGIPVYLLSSALDDFDEDKAKKAGASGRFEKPFRSEDMVKQVMDVIANPPGQTGPVYVQGLDDTFEDIDISLDSIMDSLDSPETGDEDMERAFKSAWDDVDEKKTQDNVSQASQASPAAAGASVKILDLIDDVSDEDDDVEDEGLAVETLTGSETELELELAERPPSDEAMRAFADKDDTPAQSVSGDDSAEMESEAVIPGAEETLDIGDDLSEETRAMLRAIEAEEDPIIVARPPRPEATQTRTSPVTPAVMEDALERAVKAALAEMDINAVVKAAIRSAVDDAFASKAARDVVESAVKSAMSDMAPALLASFGKVVEEMTLNVAETLVRQTIDQIKSGD
jgi:CheY-like chemotaxis protein